MPFAIDRRSEIQPINASRKKEMPWWKLPATGFNVEGEVDCLLRIYNQSLQTGHTPDQSVQQALSEVKGNIIGYKFEYIMQRLLLPNPVTLHRVNNRLRLVNNLSLQPLADITTDQERLGSVKRAVQKVEKHLTTEDGQEKMAIIQSPDGWSGLKTPDGKAITYPDTQTYMFKKDKQGRVEAFTVVTDMVFAENRHFLAKLGKDKDKVGLGADHREQVADIVENVVLLSGKEAEIGFKGVVDHIRDTRQEVMNTQVARTIKKGEGRVEERGFAEVYQDLQNDRLIDSDKSADAAITQFEKFVSPVILAEAGIHSRTREELEKMLALTVVNVSRAIKGQVALNYQDVFAEKDAGGFQPDKTSFIKELTYMKTLGGCNGGGVNSQSGVINTGLSSRLYSTESTSSSETKHCDKCNKDRKKEELGSCGLCSVCFPE